MAKAELSDKTKNNTASMLKMGAVDSSVVGTKSSSKEILGAIYKLMVQIDQDKRVQDELEKNQEKQQKNLEDKRHGELIKALTLRKKPVK
ncbi:MAG: hypothetical protein EBU90_30980, partial [Proteobacteria bacterium]|nr:hypothetical protein [Pseudomonadota bacterium]